MLSEEQVAELEGLEADCRKMTTPAAFARNRLGNDRAEAILALLVERREDKARIAALTRIVVDEANIQRDQGRESGAEYLENRLEKALGV